MDSETSSPQPKRKSKKGGNNGSGKGNSGPSYSPEEYLDLAIAYSAISEDGDIGPDQDAPTFWKRVYGVFSEKHTRRSASALMKKWRTFGAEMS